MASKDIKPKQRLGQGHQSKLKKLVGWVLTLSVCGGGAYAAYRYVGTTTVEVPVARARRADFVISVKARGEVRSSNSVTLAAPQVPQLKIVTLAASGKLVHKGDVVIEFDTAQQEQNNLDAKQNVLTADSSIVQLKASQRMADGSDNMNLLTSQYNVERAKLEQSKAAVVSVIEGEKSKVDVGIQEGQLGQVKTTINTHSVANTSDLLRLQQRKDKTVRDQKRWETYLSKMVIKAPVDGILNILPNYRTQGSFGSAYPPFKEGDNAFTGAAIAEIPDLNSMRVEMSLDEVDRGKIQLGQKVKVRVDAMPDRELSAELTWISPIASVTFRGVGLSDKSFPAYATLKDLDPRLRPGMSASTEILLESQANALLIPLRASFTEKGKPAVYIQRGTQFEIRPIEIGKRNDSDLVVVSGLKEGDQVTLENPFEAAKKAKKF